MSLKIKSISSNTSATGSIDLPKISISSTISLPSQVSIASSATEQVERLSYEETLAYLQSE